MSRISSIAVVLAATLLFVAAGCGDGGDEAAAGGDGDTKLSLVAYSTPREAYEGIVPAFQKTAAGAGVGFDQSYGSSGEQSRAVEAGLPAGGVGFFPPPGKGRPLGGGGPGG